MGKKKIIFLILNIVLAIITGLLSIKTNYELLTDISKYMSLTFGFMAFILMLIYLYEKLLSKDNSKSLLIISTIIYIVISIIYGFVLYEEVGGNILQGSIMLCFYASLIMLLIVYCSVFYLWISKKNTKYIIKTLVTLLVIIALCLVFTLVSKKIEVSSLFAIMLNFIYLSSILILTAFIIIFIVYKLVLPIKEK